MTKDDLVDAVQDDRVLDALVTRLTTVLTPLFRNMLHEFAENFKSTMEQYMEKIATDVVARSCDPLKEKIKLLETENASIRLRVDELENYSRMDNLIIHGLPESSYAELSSDSSVSQDTPTQTNQETLKNVLNFCQARLGLDVEKSDISIAHRIPRGKHDKHRPIIVRFSSRQARNSLLAARKSLRTSNSTSSHSGTAAIFINEHLTKSNAHIFSRTRVLAKEKKIHSTWTANGLVFIRRTDSTTEKPKKISSLKDLDEI